MEKSLGTKIKEMKEHRIRFKKLEFYKKIIACVTTISCITFLLEFIFNIANMVPIVTMIVVIFILLLPIIITMEKRALTKYLIAASDTDIDLGNSVRLYEDDIPSSTKTIKVEKKQNGGYQVVIESKTIWRYEVKYIDVKEAYYYMYIC